MLTRLTPVDYRRVRWKNGLGWTTELAVQQAHAESGHLEQPFDWRVSIAEVDADCEFSCFPDIDRSLLVLAGEGMALTVGDAPAVELIAGGDPLAFPGEAPVRARLIGGPTRDFNVMTRRGRVEHALTRHALADPLPLTLTRDAGEGWLIYVERGHVQIDTLAIGADECGRIEFAAIDEAPLVLRGSAALVLVHLRRSAR